MPAQLFLEGVEAAVASDDALFFKQEKMEFYGCIKRQVYR